MTLPDSRQDLLERVRAAVVELLAADRATIWLNDEATSELYTPIDNWRSGPRNHIRLPNHLGIVGEAFSSGISINIPDAYADVRINRSFDKSTGYQVRSMLTVPIRSTDGSPIGVVQVINKLDGPFTEDDEARLNDYLAKVFAELAD